IEPVSYFDMLSLIEKCKAVFTDSGGLQKESYFMKKPCITIRNETEWTELLEIGANKLVGPDKNSIIRASENIPKISLNIKNDIYGNGNASEKIISLLLDDFIR
ncbi:MAG: UDP-N-acetyl glucosamine 2-epimerase, partial [Candidatus Methanofastidiosa archaeon]|nr:UDP-N-acetyl glucosamine 2-epimerase [Candidatus Methanofastidiosa archaeon]